MESWINGDGSLSATGAVAERSAYQAETLSDVRLLLHRVNLSRVSDCSLLFKPVGDFRVVYEQVCVTFAIASKYVDRSLELSPGGYISHHERG